MATLMGSFRPPSCRSMVRATLTRVSQLEHALSRLLRAGAPDSVLFSRAHEALATPFSSAGATGLGCVIRNRSTWLEVCQVMIRFGLEQMRVVLRNRSRAKPAARVGTSGPNASFNGRPRADLHGGINKDGARLARGGGPAQTCNTRGWWTLSTDGGARADCVRADYVRYYPLPPRLNAPN